MTLYASAQKEQFSFAYAHAVATVAGLSISSLLVDDDSVDFTLAKRGGAWKVRSPRLDVQLKCTSTLVRGKDVVTFQLPRKNYEELCSEDYMVPRILVVMQVPKSTGDWLSHSELETTLRYGAWWASLEGSPHLKNGQGTKAVRLPRTQVFNPDAVRHLVERLGRGESLGG